MKEGGGRGERRIEGMGEKDEKRRGGEEGRGKKRKEGGEHDYHQLHFEEPKSACVILLGKVKLLIN